MMYHLISTFAAFAKQAMARSACPALICWPDGLRRVSFLVWSLSLLWIAAWTSSAHAQDCIIDSPSTLVLPPYDPTKATPPVAWQLKLRGIRGCEARLQISNIDAVGRVSLAGGSGSERLQMSLATQANGGAPLPPAPADVAVVTLSPGQEKTLLLWLQIDASQWVGAGLYQRTLALRILSASGQTLDMRETRLVSEVLATAKAQFSSVSGSGGRTARLDFGELRQGAQRSATLDVLANTAHTLSIASTGRSRLVNRQNPSSRIAWLLRVNGQPVSLESGSTQLPFLSQGRIRYVFEAQIGQVERVLAGDYADDLLITITAQ